MATVDTIIQVTVTRSTATISRQGFSTPLIAAATPWSDRVRTYVATTALTSLVADGVASTTALYKAVQSMLAQDPRPTRIKIGKIDSAMSQVAWIVPTAANSLVYSGRVNEQPWTFTSDASATLAEVVTGIAAAIDALSGVTAVGSSGTQVVVTNETANTLVNISRPTGAGVYSVADMSDRVNIVDSLNLIRSADKDWYVLGIDSRGSADILDAAAWAETQKIIFAPTTSDSDVALTGNTTSIGFALKALGYMRTVLFYHPDSTSFLGLETLATMLPYNPGAVTGYYRSPSGSSDAQFTETQQTQLTLNNVNFLTTISGLRKTLDGKAVGGDFVDNTMAIDWAVSRIQEDLFQWLSSQPKVPYEDRSVETAKAVMNGVMQLGIVRGVIAADPAPFADGPKVADVSVVDRGNRHLPDLTFSFRLSGGIKTVEVQGTVSV